MQKIGTITSSATANGEFTDGIVAAGVEPTILAASWFNTIQREIVNVILSAGMTLDKNDDSQLVKAIRGLGNTTVGKFEFSMKRANELDAGWYSLNGDTFLLSSPQGKILNSFSANFKSDWGIKVSSNRINLPSLFTADGRGAFIRGANGTTRMIGSFESDAIRNIKGRAMSYFRGNGWKFDGAMFHDGIWNAATGGGNSDNWGGYIGFDASKAVPTADENRPINIGMTVAIYLGV